MHVISRIAGLAVAGGIFGASLWCHGADYVIHISVDGLRPDFMQSVITAGNAPNFKRFQDEGAWTNNARTDYTHTITLPNHTSMITGRPVSQPAGLPAQTQHGYTDNSDPLPTTTLHNFTTPDWYKASTFDVVKNAGLSTALYASKSKFILYDQSYNGSDPTSDGQDKIDTYFEAENIAPTYSLTMQNALLADLQLSPERYTFVHYADTDTAGHAFGWGSTNYNNAVKTVDGYLGDVFNRIAANPVLAGHTAVILSADHGGNGTGHSDETLAVDYTIPFFAWGAGVAHGDIYSFNTDTRTNPGTSRPTYTVAGQPIRNGDGGNLALDLLGLGPIPGSLINFAQNLRVAAAGDFNADGYVDAKDYVVWRKNLNAPYTATDYTAWRAQFGLTPSGSGAADGLSSGETVPEPTAIGLILLAAIGFATVGVRRTR